MIQAPFGMDSTAALLQYSPMTSRARRPSMMPRLLILLFLVLLGGGVMAQEPVGPQLPPVDPAQEPALPTRPVRFQSMARMQVEVWLSGRRVGFTPFQVSLPDGTFLMTAVGESMVPIVQDITVGPGADMVWLPPDPLTNENHQETSRSLLRSIVNHPANAHLLIASLHMVLDPTDARNLLEKADAAIPGDPVVDMLRARHQLRAGELDLALASAQRGVKDMEIISMGWRRLAEVHLARGELTEALTAANAAVLREPLGWRNLRVRAQVHQAMGTEDAAAVDTERADELYATMHRIMEGLRQ
jgi:hypothetical protein